MTKSRDGRCEHVGVDVVGLAGEHAGAATRDGGGGGRRAGREERGLSPPVSTRAGHRMSAYVDGTDASPITAAS